MDIREYSNYNENEIIRLYSSVGWTAYTDDPQTLRQGFQNSLLVLAAYENDDLLGIVRVVGDGFTIVFVQDILVFPEKQRKGVGTAYFPFAGELSEAAYWKFYKAENKWKIGLQ